jgi:fructose-bisphosphate aldolase, class I
MITQVRRPILAELELSPGKRTRLHRLLYGAGPANGTLLLLPIDQGLEHGPRDFFANPASKDPLFQLRIAQEGRFSGIVFHIGLAEKYMQHFAGEVPLILKLNGKTEIPSDAAPISPCVATVEDAVRLGADAVGYTLYVGSSRQDEDFEQFRKVRVDADRYGMPVIVWSYPRGEFAAAKGGTTSLYAVDYAARVASELGADVVKLNMPRLNPEKDQTAPKPYNTLQVTREEAVRMVVESAGRALVIFAGGEMESDEELIT